VLVATPDHGRAVAVMAALQLGKHAFVKNPLPLPKCANWKRPPKKPGRLKWEIRSQSRDQTSPEWTGTAPSAQCMSMLAHPGNDGPPPLPRDSTGIWTGVLSSLPPPPPPADGDLSRVWDGCS
jgi:hypothetical protein